MHLLQAGVDITLIALWLGHESIQTTHGYVEADLATKEQVVEKSRRRVKRSNDLRQTTRSCVFSPRFDNADKNLMKTTPSARSP